MQLTPALQSLHFVQSTISCPDYNQIIGYNYTMDQVMNLFIAAADWFVRTFIYLVNWLYHILLNLFRSL
jgi:hypothetical protein